MMMNNQGKFKEKAGQILKEQKDDIGYRRNRTGG
jgi:hypothetical protein